MTMILLDVALSLALSVAAYWVGRIHGYTRGALDGLDAGIMARSEVSQRIGSVAGLN